MNAISFIMLIFAVLGAFDRLIGNKLKLGAEFERGFLILGPVTLSMLGMIVIAPALSVWLEPVFEGFYNLFGIDPSIISASLLANDMGGAALSLLTDGPVTLLGAEAISKSYPTFFTEVFPTL